jgi:hypothetical protein
MAINPKLKTRMKLTDLKEDPRNARRHGVRNLDAIKNSLNDLGQQKPIVVRGGIIVAGNGTFRAAQALGWDEIAIVEFEGDATMARQFAIADNRTAELAEWDYPVLGSEFKSITEAGGDLAKIGWEPFEAAPLMEATWSPPAPAETLDGEGAAAADPHAPLPKEGALFGSFTEAQQSHVLKALQAVRDRSEGTLSNEEAIVAVCQMVNEVLE